MALFLRNVRDSLYDANDNHGSNSPQKDGLYTYGNSQRIYNHDGDRITFSARANADDDYSCSEKRKSYRVFIIDPDSHDGEKHDPK
jgi:hypothetical protein